MKQMLAILALVAVAYTAGFATNNRQDDYGAWDSSYFYTYVSFDEYNYGDEFTDGWNADHYDFEPDGKKI